MPRYMLPRYVQVVDDLPRTEASLRVRKHELRDRGMDPLSFRWLTFQTRYRSEMDFSWEAMGDSDKRVKQLRKRMVAWGPAAGSLGEAATLYDRRYREAVADDLDMPSAVKVVNELVSEIAVPDQEKYALLASWDQVLGLDLERDAEAGWEPSPEMLAIMAERDSARASKDYARSDDLRERLAAMSLEVMDTPDGTRVRPL